MNIAFFEVRLFGLTRYATWLANEISELNSDAKFYFFYEQQDLQDVSAVLEKMPKNSEIIKVESISSDNIMKLLESYNLDKLIVMAQRIPDSAIVSAAKKLGIETYMYQHGLYVPFMKREANLFLNNIIKSVRYAQYAFAVAGLIGVSKIKILISYIKIFIFGKNIMQLNLPVNKINTDWVLVYGEFWKKYHQDNYGYTQEQQIVVGAPDFADMPAVADAAHIEKRSVCYIAQSLVEDGRLNRAIMEKFLHDLSEIVERNNLKLSIKLHPRSDLSLYEHFSSSVEMSKADFPIANTYIGHYSSIIAKSTFYSNNILLVDFPEHEIPDYIKAVASQRMGCDAVAQLESALLAGIDDGIDMSIVKKNVSLQNKYFDSTIKDPLKYAATRIVN